MSNGILALTVNTRSSPNLEIWKKSAERYGYNYEVLGLGEKWGGWKWRTKKYIEAINIYKNFDIFILCDSDDLYFTGPCSEFLEKFIEMKSSIVIGVESNCCSVHLPSDEKKEVINTLFEIQNSKNIDSKYYTPNGGCIFGYQEAILDLLYKISDYDDDQYGYTLEYIKDNNIMKLDYYQNIVGNHLQLIFRDIIYDWEIGDNNRPYNVTTGTYPVIMHFPVKNYDNYQTFLHEDDKNVNLSLEMRLRGFFRKSQMYIIFLAIFIVIFICKFIKKNN